MAHNDVSEDCFESELNIAEFEDCLQEDAIRTQVQADWEKWEETEWSIWYDKMMDFPGRSFDHAFLTSLRCDYVPDNIWPCPHCRNTEKMAKRNELYRARAAAFYDGWHENLNARFERLEWLIGALLLGFALVLYFTGSGKI